MELAKKITAGDAEKMKVAEEIYDLCGNMGGGTDECDTAAKIGTCFMSNGAKKDLKFL